MENIISTLAPLIPPAALPLLIAVVLVIWVYYKLQSIKADREVTKAARDKDSQELHDIVQKNTWEINNLKMEAQHRDTLLDDLRAQCNELNTNLALVSQKLDTLVEAIKELKKWKSYYNLLYSI